MRVFFLGLLAVATGCLRADGDSFEVRVNGTDVVTMRLHAPTSSEGSEAAGLGIVFIQGGFVDATRYEWQALEWARHGAAVIVPEQVAELGFFSVDYGERAREVLAERSSPGMRFVVAGHSLGGVVAAKLAAQGTFDALILEASYPDSPDVAALEAMKLPSLSLGGSLDCSAKPETVHEGWLTLPSPTALVMVEGMTHYQFTDAQTEDDQRGCTPGITIDAAHEAVSAASLEFLATLNTDGGVGTYDAIDGVTVERR